jgi:hypothetical protein
LLAGTAGTALLAEVVVAVPGGTRQLAAQVVIPHQQELPARVAVAVVAAEAIANLEVDAAAGLVFLGRGLTVRAAR